MTTTIYLWGGFALFVVTMMALDLGVFHRDAHKVGLREAAAWVAAWVVLALVFNGVVWIWRGPRPALEFLAGFLIEWSLSMDNVFVFALIFSYFRVPSTYQHRVLFWGILGAVVMRLIFILAGVALLERFHWLIYVLATFLIFTAIKLVHDRDKEADLGKNWVVRAARRWLPMTEGYAGQRFFVRQDGRRLATPLFLVLVVVETTDVAFAVDSIPAIFGVSQDPFIVFTSNIFAILGLRALYFLLAGAIEMFRFLDLGLSAILFFVGSKMLISRWYDIPVGVSLGIIAALLATAVAASLIASRRERRQSGARLSDQRENTERRV
jgi:tellurite resistance protein TerC